MSTLDWIVLVGTLVLIAAYGTWRTRNENSREDYLRAGNTSRWWAVGFGVVATQLSAVTFLSTPGQGYLDGMRFIQFYFGLPLAMVVICVVFIPMYYKWKVYTAYEFIGKRFDRRMRLFTAFLFLVQRSFAAGITIYAPSIILSTVLHIPFVWTFAITGLVVLYTTTGGAKAVSATQTQQMAVIFIGLAVTFGMVVHYLAEPLPGGQQGMSFVESLKMAGAMGHMNIISTEFNANDRYTLWTGLLGGFFLQLSYFGTDQSQVGRYLSGSTSGQAKLGMIFNGLIKIPFQFIVLLCGVLVFVFYLFHAAPVHWNGQNVELLHKSPAAAQMKALEERHDANTLEIGTRSANLLEAIRSGEAAGIAEAGGALKAVRAKDDSLRNEVKVLLLTVAPAAEKRDDDHIFLSFAMGHLPSGLIGLLLAVMLSASMSTSSAELNALASTTTVDVIKREWKGNQQVTATRWATIVYGILAMAFAGVAAQFGNLIQAVNILGSLFYGTILGIFLVAFFCKRVQGTAVFIAAVVAQVVILVMHFSRMEVAFLWYNLIAPVITVVLAVVLQEVLPSAKDKGLHSSAVEE
ncbi:MAG: sodium:solute symporter [Flavobacteriales bacterium]|nr:sodium:solute symporter [Flavobacteriales bacterium]